MKDARAIVETASMHSLKRLLLSTRSIKGAAIRSRAQERANNIWRGIFGSVKISLRLHLGSDSSSSYGG
eukprot:1340516-Amorphochlora_amoeboformis.AAC.2